MVRTYLRGAVMARDSAGWLSAASLAHTLALVGALAILIATTTLPGDAAPNMDGPGTRAFMIH